jgi:fused signal recognition particle receptor
MFGKLKDKLKSWTKKISEKAEEEIPEKEEPKKEVQVPVKYNVGAHKYEPDLEKLEEIKKEVQSEQDLEKFEEVKKEISEEPKPGEKGFLKKITSRISKIKISEKEFEIYSDELEMLLLENNVALEVAEKMVEELKEEIIG